MSQPCCAPVTYILLSPARRDTRKKSRSLSCQRLWSGRMLESAQGTMGPLPARSPPTERRCRAEAGLGQAGPEAATRLPECPEPSPRRLRLGCRKVIGSCQDADSRCVASRRARTCPFQKHPEKAVTFHGPERLQTVPDPSGLLKATVRSDWLCRPGDSRGTAGTRGEGGSRGNRANGRWLGEQRARHAARHSVRGRSLRSVTTNAFQRWKTPSGARLGA